MHKEHVFSEGELLSITRQVAKGLHHLHSLNLVHLDIKPDNIYIAAEGVFKIGDFGLVSRADSREIVEVTASLCCNTNMGCAFELSFVVVGRLAVSLS